MMAEGMGFEPTIGVTLYTRSRRAPSTARTPLCVYEEGYFTQFS